jgi:metal-responsive CopG/Arc/MetJ family transcriptional regulator
MRQISLRIPDQIVQDFDKFASQIGLNRSELLNVLIEYGTTEIKIEEFLSLCDFHALNPVCCSDTKEIRFLCPPSRTSKFDESIQSICRSRNEAMLVLIRHILTKEIDTKTLRFIYHSQRGVVRSVDGKVFVQYRSLNDKG